MNESLQVSLASVLTKAVATVEKGTEFLIAELPDVAQQLLIWKMAESLLYFVLGVVLFVVSCVVFTKTFKCWDVWMKREGYWSSNKEGTATLHVIVGLTTGTIAVPTMIFNLTWLQIWLAPKVFLVEFAAKLIR